MAHLLIGLSLLCALSSTARSQPAADDRIEGAFRVILSSDEFPFEQYRQFTRAGMKTASAEVLAAVRGSSTVYRVDLDMDGLVDCVIEVSLHARNSQFFVVHRVDDGWKITCDFVAQAFSLHWFGGDPPRLKTIQNLASGRLIVSSYAFRDGRYLRTETHEERTDGSIVAPKSK
jgi:hypothetical protein